MTEEQRQTISELAEKAGKARRAYEASRQWNVYGLTPEDRAKQDVAAELLMTEMLEANAVLGRAQAVIAQGDEG